MQLALLAAIGATTGLALATLAHFTRDRIARNAQAWIQQHLDALVPPHLHDNDLLNDTIAVRAPDSLGTSRPVTIYRARLAGRPTAAVIRSVAPDGYRGPIELLVAIAPDGTLIGVRVLHHDETPGLGDFFEKRDPRWLDRFRGLSLSNPPQQRWSVKRDGGDFDAFTGATITPRAIVTAVRRTLEYYQRDRERILAAAPADHANPVDHANNWLSVPVPASERPPPEHSPSDPSTSAPPRRQHPYAAPGASAGGTATATRKRNCQPATVHPEAYSPECTAMSVRP